MSTLVLATAAAVVASFCFYQCCILLRSRDYDYLV